MVSPSLIRSAAKALKRKKEGYRPEVEEAPTDIVTFIEGEEYLNQPKLYPRQRSAVEQFFAPGSKYSELILRYGKGSGKDFLASCCILYMVHVALCFDDPQEFYGLAPGHHIHFINVAQSAPQAQGVYFDGNLRPKLDRSKWFQERGFKIVTNPLPMVRFDKGIFAISAHSQNESYEGYNILGYVMDEAAAFTSDTKRANADKIYSTLRTSMRSRFPKHGKGIILSYPRHEGDFIMKRYEEAADEPWVLRDSGATWEINLSLKRSDFDQDYKHDLADAQCKYECLPPAVISAYIPPELIIPCMIGAITLPELLPQMPTKRYLISLDPGLKNDKFAMGIGHTTLGDPMIYLDHIRYWQGTRSNPVIVEDPYNQFEDDVESAVIPLARRLNAVIITDPYEMVQTAERWRMRWGVNVVVADVDTRAQMEAWRALKSSLVFKKLVLPKDVDDSPSDQLFKELKRLQIHRSGDLWNVSAPEGENDDLADMLCRMVWYVDCTPQVDLESWRGKTWQIAGGPVVGRLRRRVGPASKWL